MGGFTLQVRNPDSWEGWYWGATHHYGSSMRVGIPPSYSTVEDAVRRTKEFREWLRSRQSV